METEPVKLFVGGISLETSEETLKDYFGKYGVVKDTEIPRDRNTGKERGFGFVTLAADLFLINNVINSEHIIHGRTVEVKLARPQGEKYPNQQCPYQLMNNVSSRNGCDGSCHKQPLLSTKKIFVGGLPPSLNKEEFKSYFASFGDITDAVMMYDKGNNRPRGFGFITFDSEAAVDNVLQRRFHKLNDKDVEVKRAEPKDRSIKQICTYGCCNKGGLGFERLSVTGCSRFYTPYECTCNISPACMVHGRNLGYYYGAYSPYGTGFLNSLPNGVGYEVGSSSSSWNPIPYGNQVIYTTYGGYMNGWASGPVGVTDGGGGGSSSSYQENMTLVVTGNSNEDESGGDTEVPASVILRPALPEVGKSNDEEHQKEANSQSTLINSMNGSACGAVGVIDGGGDNCHVNAKFAVNSDSNEDESGGDNEVPSLVILRPALPEAGDALCSQSGDTENQKEADCQSSTSKSSRPLSVH